MEVTVGDVVGLGSSVTVRDEFGDSSYTIVGPVEADVAGGRISMVSPLGAALMGRTVGDEVKFSSPGGTRSAVVTAVS
jgi:transcription elongation GreA/GreB family factor